jgi:hypothetical protein
MNFEIIVRQIDNGIIINESLIKEITVAKPKNIQEVGFRHEEQVRIIAKYPRYIFTPTM